MIFLLAVRQPQEHVGMAGGGKAAKASEILTSQLFDFFEVKADTRIAGVADVHAELLDSLLLTHWTVVQRVLAAYFERVAPLGRPRNFYGVWRHFPALLAGELHADRQKCGVHG
jgi:hypothetical protein